MQADDELQKVLRSAARLQEIVPDAVLVGWTGVASQLLRQLSEPKPADARTISELSSYKGLAPKWHDWPTVSAAARTLAKVMVTGDQAR